MVLFEFLVKTGVPQKIEDDRVMQSGKKRMHLSEIRGDINTMTELSLSDINETIRFGSHGHLN